jgi:radical SAM-linked protein
VIRRAGLRPVYSQGFNPKPRFTFGPALALGVASLDEKIDVDLFDPPGAQALLDALNAASGAGLRFTDARPLERGQASLGSAIVGARYIVVFPEAFELSTADLEGKIAAFLQRDKIIVKRSVKGIGRLIDVRAKVRSLRMGDAATRLNIARAGFVGRLTSVVVEVDLGPEGSVKPSEVVEALTGDGDLPHQAIREALLLAAVTPTKPEMKLSASDTTSPIAGS